jgi:hypothetical protein
MYTQSRSDHFTIAPGPLSPEPSRNKFIWRQAHASTRLRSTIMLQERYYQHVQILEFENNVPVTNLNLLF